MYIVQCQEIATGNYLVPLTTAMLQTTTTGYATASAQRYFAQINSNGQPNATALQLIATAPQTIAPGISWTMINLRPYKYVSFVIFAVGLELTLLMKCTGRAGCDARWKHILMYIHVRLV